LHNCDYAWQNAVFGAGWRNIILMQAIFRIAKCWLRGPYHKTRLRYVRWRHGFGQPELVSALRSAGIDRDDAIIVHSSMRSFEAFGDGATGIIAAFREVIGPDGTLMMPTLSMAGSAIDFANSGRLFDPRTTASQVGLLPEVFRRSPGVTRSIHPTHSVAVLTRDAEWWVKDHHLADTPCGRGTPFHRLLERDGKIVFAGTDIAALTFFHCAEELLEERMPFSPFTQERYVMRCKVNGKVIETAPVRLYAPDVSRRRRLAPLETRLRSKGLWHESRIENLTISVVRAGDVLATLEEMAAEGTYCYLPAHPPEGRISHFAK
jgi:aminoglycoside 3-N-acetyltransferase